MASNTAAAGDAVRQAFKPTRASRASLGSAVPAKENHSTAAAPSRKKRAQSLGGEALESAMKMRSLPELSPGQAQRRKAAPRRSILKSSSATAIFQTYGDNTGTLDAGDARYSSAHTTDLSSLSTFNNRRRSSVRGIAARNDDEEDDSDQDGSDDGNGTMDMDITRMTQTDLSDDRRKSLLSRRVSFAPNAHIRMFTPDKITADAQARQAHFEAQQAANDAAAAAAAEAGSNAANWSSSEDEDEDEDSFESEPSMEMAADEVTHAFAGHFAGTKMPVSVLQGAATVEDESAGESESEDGDGSVEMDVANTAEITSAFAQQKTSVFNSQQQQWVAVGVSTTSTSSTVTTAKAKPRFSEVVRQEDAEDAEILRQLGLAKGDRASQSPRKRGSVMFGGVPSSDNDDALMEVDEDAETEDDRTAPMEMTTALGSVVVAPPAVVAADEIEEEQEEEQSSMEMSMAEKTMDLDQTADMQDATTYGSILAADTGVAAPSTPSARLRAELHARQVAQGITPTASPKRSPRRLSVVPSPARPSRLSIVALPEPVSIPASPARAASPVKLAAVSPRKIAQSPRRAPSSAAKIAATPPRSASPEKSATTLTPARTPRTSTFTPKVLVPPQSAGRSPGGSLSLRGLLQEQLARNPAANVAQSSPKSYPPPSSLAKSPKRRASASWDSPRAKLARVAESKEDLTGSSFGGYGDEGQTPAPILSLDDFFDATGTGFMKDVLGMTGVELGSKRRKSIAPAGLGRAPSGPPSFSDLAVAGACKSLFHQLYQSDHLRLQEEITNVMNQLAQCEEALQFEQPKVFTDWSSASEAQRLQMQGQFRMIKAHYYLVGRIEWNECRAQNHQSIIEVMEENLDGLRADNAVVEGTHFDTVLPELEARRAALLAELHEERQRDVELSACDPEELSSMHAAVAEQAEELEKLERGYNEVAAPLASLEAKAQDLAAAVVKSTAERDDLVQKLEEGRCFTKAEVFRLQAEYDALQQLNGWTLLSFDKSTVTLRHLDEFDVSLALSQGRVDDVKFELVSTGDDKSQLEADVTAFLFSSMQQQIELIHQSSPSIRARSIIRRVDALWTCARRLRHEVLLVNRRYPTTATVDSSRQAMTVSAEIHVHAQKATFAIEFTVDGDELFAEEEGRPAEVRHVVARLGSDVRVRFGQVDVENLKYLVRERIDPSEQDTAGQRGALVAACTAAEIAC